MNKKLVDIDRVLEEKNPKFKKWAPNILISFLKRIVHQDFINNMLSTYGDKKNAAFCEAVLNHMNISVVAHGIENIPEKGGCYLAGNHPFGGIDALATVHATKDRRPDIKFIVNDLLMNIENLNEMFYGINKHGKSASESLKKINDLFAGDDAVFIFPAGLVSRKQQGKICDLEWKKTFITRAKKNNKTIVPVYIEGRLSNFFYNLANLRTKLGIKVNLEMLFLVNEMRKHSNKTIHIYFGKPIDPKRFDKTKTDKEWANWVKGKAYAQKNK